jgi:hypothetical protein
MSYMFEVYYKPPVNSQRETALTKQVEGLGGCLDFREEPTLPEMGGICLTYEFESYDLANTAAKVLRDQGEHVEGPVEYGLTGR